MELTDSKGNTKFSIKYTIKIILGTILLVMLLIGLILAAALWITSNQPYEQQEIQYVEDEQTCVELFDMEFTNEQECWEFAQHLLDTVEDKSDPLIMKLLEKYNP